MVLASSGVESSSNIIFLWVGIVGGALTIALTFRKSVARITGTWFRTFVRWAVQKAMPDRMRLLDAVVENQAEQLRIAKSTHEAIVGIPATEFFPAQLGLTQRMTAVEKASQGAVTVAQENGIKVDAALKELKKLIPNGEDTDNPGDILMRMGRQAGVVNSEPPDHH